MQPLSSRPVPAMDAKIPLAASSLPAQNERVSCLENPRFGLRLFNFSGKVCRYFDFVCIVVNGSGKVRRSKKKKK